ncbi:hypothetical protein PUR71_00870 [Streptomyces sp. SP17BM10]|nr:hypothetical protein [Streptomyces sp. SP17BM10]MEE1781498.1 hypothetical protein [Streptomyces sp. SP17BM10]
MARYWGPETEEDFEELDDFYGEDGEELDELLDVDDDEAPYGFVT